MANERDKASSERAHAHEAECAAHGRWRPAYWGCPACLRERAESTPAAPAGTQEPPPVPEDVSEETLSKSVLARWERQSNDPRMRDAVAEIRRLRSALEEAEAQLSQVRAAYEVLEKGLETVSLIPCRLWYRSTCIDRARDDSKQSLCDTCRARKTLAEARALRGKP